MKATRLDYDDALKALDSPWLTDAEREACQIVIADYTCGGQASFKPTRKEIKLVAGAAQYFDLMRN